MISSSNLPEALAAAISSKVTASSNLKCPELSLTSPPIWAPVPSSSPMSAQRVLMYVPFRAFYIELRLVGFFKTQKIKLVDGNLLASAPPPSPALPVHGGELPCGALPNT